MAALVELVAVFVAQDRFQNVCLLGAGSAALAGPLAQKNLAAFQEPAAADIQTQADIDHRTKINY